MGTRHSRGSSKHARYIQLLLLLLLLLAQICADNEDGIKLVASLQVVGSVSCRLRQSKIKPELTTHTPSIEEEATAWLLCYLGVRMSHSLTY